MLIYADLSVFLQQFLHLIALYQLKDSLLVSNMQNSVGEKLKIENRAKILWIFVKLL